MTLESKVKVKIIKRIVSGGTKPSFDRKYYKRMDGILFVAEEKKKRLLS